METPLRMVSVAETAPYAAQADRLLSEDERQGIVDMLTVSPEIGAVITGAGGARKVRFALQGRGKSGGARVIYFFHNEGMPLYLLGVYAKNEKGNISPAEKNDMQKRCKALVEFHTKQGK